MVHFRQLCDSLQAALLLRSALSACTKFECLLEGPIIFGEQTLLEHPVVYVAHETITQHDVLGKRSEPG